jgi:hypothetical protein
MTLPGEIAYNAKNLADSYFVSTRETFPACEKFLAWKKMSLFIFIVQPRLDVCCKMDASN